ncbi:MAG: hypothetical protein IT385_00815 [Deltaproteobacteria bacterium]|nr:hypothetical protein [Deltaproteobacteria bacterium]
MRAIRRKHLVHIASALALFVGQGCTDPAPIEGAACNAEHVCPGGFACAGGACRRLAGGPVVRCADDAACPVGRCLVATGFCVQCLDAADCVQSACLPELYQCGCQDNGDCATGRCNVLTATCLSCYADAQCDSGQCDRDTGVCRPPEGPIHTGDATDEGGGS